ncbi:hypothetical protein IJ732_06830 [bacterium]|nr:hypothetical protein [bacterium]
MKKFLILIFVLFLQIPFVKAEPLNGEVSFDWISKSQMERDANIAYIRNLLFTSDTVKNYGRRYIKKMYKSKLKDEDYLKNYNDVALGKTEDYDKKYCAFFWKQYLIAYGIQYKRNPDKNFYYDAMGHLKWIDMYSEEYPNFPYRTYQYGMNGRLKAVYYFINSYDQYIYDAHGKFQGRWYKDKMYDKKANVIMTRSSWDE